MPPVLTAIPSPPLEWRAFALGPLTIHTYALIIVAGIVVSVLWTNQRMTRRGGEPWVIIDIAMPAVLLGLVGARLWHVFTHPADYFYPGANFWNIFAIWEGGNAIIGALIGGAIGAWLVCRVRGIRFLSFADAAAPTILLAQAIGRLGNWFNHELFGWPTNLPWGLEILPTNPAYPSGLPAGTLFHPTFLYELLWNLAGVGVLLLLERMLRWRGGRMLAGYLIWYGLGRMAIESIRVDYSEVIFGMRSNVFGALLMVLVGVAVYIVATRRDRETPLERTIYVSNEPFVPEDTDAKTAGSTAPDAATADSVETQDSTGAEGPGAESRESLPDASDDADGNPESQTTSVR